MCNSRTIRWVFTALITINLYSQSCPSSSSLKAFTGYVGWHHGATVDVYIISNSIPRAFSSDEIAEIENALTTWNADNSSAITWTFHVVSTAPTLTDPYITIQLGTCTNHADGCVSTTPDSTTGETLHSVVTFDPTYTAPLDALASHEVGHAYGIDDCSASDCFSNVTIMFDNPITTTSHTRPVCCDKKLLYTMTGGAYGQSTACTPTLIQGAAYVDSINTNNWQDPSVTTTFGNTPEPGNSIVVGCMNVNYNGAVSVSDSASNSYTLVQSVPGSLYGYAPVAIFVANQIQTATNLTVTCSLPPGSNGDAINVFALEYSGLSTTLTAVDGTTSNTTIANPLSCGGITTTSTNDLIVSIYNNFTGNSPASVSPTSGSIPTCSGGDGGYCAAFDGNIYEVGALATWVVGSTGTYSPGFNGPTAPMSCGAAGLKTLGQ